ncbi:MAG: FkbM family methyltransferase [Patescibacteria group bacterium]|nr:FkbM family methyltransferase [Patescibacteria group bacterium]
MKKFLQSIIRIINTKTNYLVTTIRETKWNGLGRTAVKSKDGFWYVGNVFDSADIAYGIATNGVVEKDEHDLVCTILKFLSKQGNISFYDIGANTGYYGILAAFLGKPSTHSFFFEPLPQHTQCIEETLKINDLEKQGKIFQTALGEKPDKMIFYTAGSGSTLLPEFVGKNIEGHVHVSVQKLDTLQKENALALPDFIKIDVEGYELPVLIGAENTLREAQPVLFIEVAQTLRSAGRNFKNKKYRETFDYLKKFGYTGFIHKDGKLLPAANIEKIDGVWMYLFLNKEKHQDLAQFLGLPLSS